LSNILDNEIPDGLQSVKDFNNIQSHLIPLLVGSKFFHFSWDGFYIRYIAYKNQFHTLYLVSS